MIALYIIGGLLAACAVFGAVVSIILAIKYIKYNRKQNSCGMTGQDIARKLLDENGCEKVKVKCVGSILFGNSYSHLFKKVRLRRLTWKKKSVTSLAMAAQKSSLAVLDHEKDPIMKTRNILVPIMNFGPIAFIPLIAIGVVLDLLLAHETYTVTVVASIIGFSFYLLTFIIAIVVLKVEKKAQEKAIELLKKDNLATLEEIEDCKALFKLYNLEYINDVIVSFLEMIYRILQIFANGKYSSSKNR